MKRPTLKPRFAFSLTAFLILLFLTVLWPERSAMTQLPPPPPPAPGMPSILEDIRDTRHNLSSVAPPDRLTFERLYGPNAERRVYTEGTSEVCIFCHTPHGASAEAAAQVNAPLWNRSLSSARYILYDQVWSTSFEAYEVNPPKPGAPTGYSRLCLSCHDGTIALGTVTNAPGSGGYNEQGFIIRSPTGTLSDRMPVGSGPSTGDTRLIGTNLQNDHPISFIYDPNLAHRDEELVDPGPALVPPAKVGDPTPISPLRRYAGMDQGRFDSVQCTSCHNPHAATYPKFLRTSNFNNDPQDPNYGSGSSKILCLYCHDKPGWTGSSHDADTFVPPPSPTAENAYNFDGSHTVGQYACRACHDPHTAQGAKRILREGVDAFNNFAIENTCFQCHKPKSELGSTQPDALLPPDIRSEFMKETLGSDPMTKGSAMSLTLSQGHEPVFVARPQEGVELFSPAPPPFNEETPGTLLQDTAHVECVDCHNPHQVIKSNRLKGMKGIDINGNVVGSKIPGNSREPYVFEVCMRCHGNSYTNVFLLDRFPDDTQTRSDPRAGIPAGPKFSLKGFSNKRKEFDKKTPDTAPGHTQQNENAAFHPVAFPGRNGTMALCKQLSVAFNLRSTVNPSGQNGDCNSETAASTTLKNITIQCTDCHNNNAFENAVRGPITGLYDGNSYKRSTDLPAAPNPSFNSTMQSLSDNPATPQGPHGSDYIRILRGKYNTDILNPARCFGSRNPVGCVSGDGRSPSHYDNFNLCFQCHDQRAFSPFVPSDGAQPWTWTNFAGVRKGIQVDPTDPWEGNLHQYHLRSSGAYCHECHYNVHSNVEAQNTAYGDDQGGNLPLDSEDGIADGITGTHLINFGPTVSPKNSGKPRWFKSTVSSTDPTEIIRCDLACHSVDMNGCYYASPGLNHRCSSDSCN